MMRTRRLALLPALAGTIALAAPSAASAHAGLGGRADLPIPVWLFAWAAAVVLLVSFVALSVLWKTPKLEAAGGERRVPWWLGMLVVNPVTDVAAGLAGVGLLFAVIWAGLAGTASPTANLAPTFIFVVFWVGLVPASLVFGDVFRVFNPWRAIGRFAGFVMRTALRQMPPAFGYPTRLGRWPAILPLVCFTWMELVYLEGQLPSKIAIASLIYTAYTLVAMAAFGVETWLDRGEGFSVYFNLLSRVSPLLVRDGELWLRKPLKGLTELAVEPGTVAVIVVAIGTVTFDGASESEVWGWLSPHVQDFFGWFGFDLTTKVELASTVGMALAVALIGAIYAVGIAGLRTVDRRPFVTDARTFAHTLIPIAAAYVLAHYFSYLVFNGQAMFYLISNPLGETGTNLFGTADVAIDYSVLGANAIWYVQVGALVTGHVAGLVLAHDRAVKIYDDPRVATRSQYWMLGVMIAFTTFGLWLLSQTNQ